VISKDGIGYEVITVEVEKDLGRQWWLLSTLSIKSSLLIFWVYCCSVR
jgi:hypothetical protein